MFFFLGNSLFGFIFLFSSSCSSCYSSTVRQRMYGTVSDVPEVLSRTSKTTKRCRFMFMNAILSVFQFES